MTASDLDSTQNMARAAATVRLAGELMESSGVRALHVTNSWKPGPRSANLDPDAGGWRYEVIVHVDGELEIVPKPSDRTGESALHPDRLEHEHDLLVANLALLAAVADEAVHRLRTAVPNPLTALTVADMTPAQVSAAGWCTSCWTDGGYHEPVSMRPNGERRYRDHCLWCGEFMAAHGGIKPPLELVQARHRGQRITAGMVNQALLRLDAEHRAAKAERKKNKKRKKAA